MTVESAGDREGHRRRRLLCQHVFHGRIDPSVASSLSEDIAMKKPAISFRHFGGSGPLSIYWRDGLLGDAIEARRGRGVAWMAPSGELLGVEFDDVAYPDDQQELELRDGTAVRVRVANGRPAVRVTRSRRRRAA
jgi:hypothetical protein